MKEYPSSIVFKKPESDEEFVTVKSSLSDDTYVLFCKDRYSKYTIEEVENFIETKQWILIEDLSSAAIREKLFYSIVGRKHDLQQLASIVQNHGDVSESELGAWNNDVDELINKLNEIKNKVNKFYLDVQPMSQTIILATPKSKNNRRYNFNQMLKYCELHNKEMTDLSDEEKLQFVIKED